MLLRIYKQTILPLMDYGCIVWGDCGKQNAQHLERLQNQAMRIILSANHKTCTQHMRSNNAAFFKQQKTFLEIATGV